MRLILSKSVILRCLLILLCVFFILFTSWNRIWTAVTNDDTRTKIGVLIRFDTRLSTSKQKVTFQQSDEKYVYKFYLNNKNAGNSFLSKIPNVMRGEVFEQKSAVAITESLNQLANKAHTDGMDYFVVICSDTDSFSRDRAIQFIQTLKEHTIPNVGVVADININCTQAHIIKYITVHKSHMEIFHQFFPPHLNFEAAIEWLEDVYDPFHITYVKSLEFKPTIQGVTGDIKAMSTELDRNKVNDFINANYNLFVVSYSLYGSNTRYTDGALANAKLVKIIYPNWRMWIYYDDSVPKIIMSSLCRQSHITCINMTGTMFHNKMSWRFLVASVPFVSRYVIRDIDSRLSQREKAAVDEWVQSGKRFHVMRDHPSHSDYPISGGMWGGKREAFPNMKTLLERQIISDKYLQDMNFLNDIVWPIAQASVYQHDSFSCEKFGGGHPFPTRRIGLKHVGSVYINGKMRKTDTDILKDTRPPRQCSPDLKE